MKDILLYVPHDGVSIDFLEEAYISLIKENFSQELLFRYMLHEADRGALEIARSTESYLRLLSPDIQVDVRTVEIPRAFCDLNRPWERSVPPALAAEVYKERYTVQIEGDRRTHLVSKKSIHIHTMCGYSPIYTWNFTPETTEHELEKFLTTCYSGRERHIDLLTHTVEGVEIGDLDIARSIG